MDILINNEIPTWEGTMAGDFSCKSKSWGNSALENMSEREKGSAKEALKTKLQACQKIDNTWETCNNHWKTV